MDSNTTAPTPNGVKAALQQWRVKSARLLLIPQLPPKEAADLRHQVIEDGSLTQGYVLMCALSAGIAILGLLQSSTAVVIGAMLVSPLMGPIARLGFGFASLDGQRIKDAARVVVVGAAIGIIVGILLTWISPIRSTTPEILARTQPTLVDLFVALLSGLAGGYATVMGKGGTAIGVAIATALMPPLATVGYGIAVFEPKYALGAFLLFMTNLSAIAFAFAAVARLGGVARPIRDVELSPRFIAIGIASFLALAVPLALMLVQVTREARLRTDAERAITGAMHANDAEVAQLTASWPLFGQPAVTAVVVTNDFNPTAEANVTNALTQRTGDKPIASIRQVVTASPKLQSRATIDDAIDRASGPEAAAAPIDRIRASAGVPTRSVWADRAGGWVYVEPFSVPDWKLADYRVLEGRIGGLVDGWQVRVVPPVETSLKVQLAPELNGNGVVDAETAAWAMLRWGLRDVSLELREGANADVLDQAFRDSGISVTQQTSTAVPIGIAIIHPFAGSDVRRATAE